MEEEKIRLGKITSAVGLKGEVKIYPYTDYKEKFGEIDYVLVEENRLSIENVRYIKSMAILKLSTVGNRTEAEKYIDKEVYILRKDAPPLPEGAHYVKDLVGLAAVDENGEPIGTLEEVIINSAQDIYMIRPEHGGSAFPVPAVEEFVKEVDMEKRLIRIRLIEGLREL